MKSFAKTTLAVVAGVFIAGLAMNAMREQAVVSQAIKGFDN